ncbi:MAG: ABC transporter permease subunit [Thermoplasmata archaeon]|nr:ABC transporter permease subunit [Thermoplasmata archaeon]
MSAILADLRRTLFAPATIVTLILVLLLAGLFDVGSTPSLGRPFDYGYNSGYAFSYEYNGGFVFWFYVFNGHGAPIAGANLTVSVPAGGNSSSVPAVSGSATTGPDGRATVTIARNDSTTEFTIESVSSGGTDEWTGPVGATPPGDVVPGPGTLSLVDSGPYDLTPTMLLFCPGPSGGAPDGPSLEIRANYSAPDPREVQLSLTPVTSDVTTYVIPRGELPLSSSRIDFLLLNRNGSELAGMSETPRELSVVPYNQTFWGQDLLEDTNQWGFVVPLVAIGLGYAAYARPRSSRSLEPVLGLPTTRAGVLIRRYVSAVVPLAVVVAAAVVIEFAIYGPVSGLAPALLAMIWAGLFLEAVAFLGFVFLLAHLLRSAGLVAVVAGGVAGFLAFFVSDTIYLVAELGHTSTPSGALGAAPLWNPTQLAGAAIGEYFSWLGSPGEGWSGLPSAGTLFGSLLAVTAFVAISAPVVALMLARRRD